MQHILFRILSIFFQYLPVEHIMRLSTLEHALDFNSSLPIANLGLLNLDAFCATKI